MGQGNSIRARRRKHGKDMAAYRRFWHSNNAGAETLREIDKTIVKAMIDELTASLLYPRLRKGFTT